MYLFRKTVLLLKKKMFFLQSEADAPDDPDQPFVVVLLDLWDSCKKLYGKISDYIDCTSGSNPEKFVAAQEITWVYLRIWLCWLLVQKYNNN